MSIHLYFLGEINESLIESQELVLSLAYINRVYKICGT